MNVACPYCKAVLTPKNLKPGRYTPNCPKCGRQFALSVVENDDDELSITVQSITKKPEPLPKTKQVPVLRLPPGTVKDDEEENEEEETTAEHDASDDIADGNESENNPLPKTAPMPIFRKPPKVLPDESDETHAE